MKAAPLHASAYQTNSRFSAAAFLRNTIAISLISCISVVSSVVGGTQRRREPITCNGTVVPFLFDTGATATLISDQAFRTIPKDRRPPRIGDCTTRFVTASGGRLACRGVYRMVMTICGETIPHDIVVIKQLTSAGILGMDVIRRLGLALDPLRNTLFFVRSAKPVDAVVTLTESFTLMPGESRLSKIRMNAMADHDPTKHASVSNREFVADIFGMSEHLITDDYARAQLYVRNMDVLPRDFGRGDEIGQAEGLSRDTYVSHFGEGAVAAILGTSGAPTSTTAVAMTSTPAPTTSRTTTAPIPSELRSAISAKVGEDLPSGQQKSYVGLLCKFGE